MLPNVMPTDASAAAVVPAGASLDVFSFAACDAASCSSSMVDINAPAIEWQQADAGAFDASLGGWVRVFGTALAFAGRRCMPTAVSSGSVDTSAGMRLVSLTGGAPVPLPLSYASCYALTAPVPADMPPGAYLVQVRNGLPSCAWTNASATGAVLHVAPPIVWPTSVFDVVKLGGVWAALAAAAQNGGGVVFFPRGRYAFDANATLNAIPPFTALVGEGTDLVTWYWHDMSPPFATPLVQGTGGHFAVRNVTIFVKGNFSTVISDAGYDGLQVSGVVLRANPYYMTLEPVDQPFHGRVMPVGSGIMQGDAIGVSAANWAITDCDIFGGAHAIAVFVRDWDAPTWFGRPRNGLIARNTIAGGWGQYRMEACDGVIVEDNALRGGGLNTYGSWVSTYYGKAAEHLYFARNSVRDVSGGDRELFSFDGGGGAYNGTVDATSADGRTLTLAADPVFAGYVPPGPRLLNYTDGAVVVLGGMGAGQVRRVVSNDWTGANATNRSWVVDAPFAVPLDASSYISIVPYRGGIIAAGNAFADGGAVQLYAMAIATTVAENTAVRTSGFLAWGLNPHGWGYQPNVANQMLDNAVLVGNAYDGQTGGFGSVTSDGGPFAGPLNRGIVLRRNTCASNAGISITGSTAAAVVEHCTVANSDAPGIAVANTTTAVWLRGNALVNVTAAAVAAVAL